MGPVLKGLNPYFSFNICFLWRHRTAPVLLCFRFFNLEERYHRAVKKKRQVKSLFRQAHGDRHRGKMVWRDMVAFFEAMEASGPRGVHRTTPPNC